MAQIIQGVMDTVVSSCTTCLLTFILFSRFVTNDVTNYFSIRFLRLIPGHHQTAHRDVRKPQIAWRTRQTLIRMHIEITEGVTKFNVFSVRGSVHRNTILTYIQQDATLHSLFYLETALHVSGGTSTHHRECIQLYLQHLVFVTPLLLPATIVAVSTKAYVCGCRQLSATTDVRKTRRRNYSF